METNIDKVYENLYIGNIDGARRTSMDHFDSVVTVCQEDVRDHIPSDVTYHFFNMCDGPDNDYGGRCDYEIFEDAASTILARLNLNDTTFVHCHMGRSRSVSTSIAAVGAMDELTYYQVYNIFEESRPQIHPDGLLEQHAKQFIEENSPIDHRIYSHE